MTRLHKTLQAIAGLLAAAVLAAGTSVLLFRNEKDILFSAGRVRVTVSGAGSGLSVLLMLILADVWIGFMRKRTRCGYAGNAVNGIGFGLLPGVALLLLFLQETSLGAGAALPDGMAAIPWLTKNGYWCPCRAEAILTIAAFVSECLWLILRKEDLPPCGDALPVSLTLLGTVGMMTCGLRSPLQPFPEIPYFRLYLACAVIAGCLAYWTAKAFRRHKNTGYAAACAPVLLVCCFIMIAETLGLIRPGREAVSLIIRAVCPLLCMKAALCMGRVTRRN